MIHAGNLCGVMIIMILAFFSGWMLFRYRNIEFNVITPQRTSIYTYIQYNAATKPISDVVLVSPVTQTTPKAVVIPPRCPNEYGEADYLFWSGLVSGCSCKDGRTFVATSCGPDCIAVNSQDGEALSIWGKASLICYKTNKDIAYIKSTANKECPDGYKVCSPTTCVKKEEDCPLVSINFMENNMILADGFTYSGDAFTGMNGKVNRVEIKRGGPANTLDPIFLLSSSIGGLPCINPSENPLRNNKNAYNMERTPRAGCQSYGDDSGSSFSIASQEELETYQANGISLQPNYYDFLNKSDDKIQLVARRKLRFTDTNLCIQFEVAQLASIQNTISDCQSGLIVFAIVFFTLLGIALILLIFSGCCKPKNAEYGLALTGIALILIACVVAFFNYIYVRGKVQTINDGVDKTYNRCSTEGNFNTALTDGRNDVNNASGTLYSISLTMMVNGIIFFVLSLVALVLVIRKRSSGSYGARTGGEDEVEMMKDRDNSWIHEDALH